MKQVLNQSETKALCDAFSFVAQTFADFRPEHCERAMSQIVVHYEVLRDLTNNDIANHFRDICITRMGDIMIQNDFKGD